MVNIARVYVLKVVKELNQMQAYVERLRNEALFVSKPIGQAGAELANERSQIADDLEQRVNETRRLLFEFKQSNALVRKKELKEEIETRLSALTTEFKVQAKIK